MHGRALSMPKLARSRIRPTVAQLLIGAGDSHEEPHVGMTTMAPVKLRTIRSRRPSADDTALYERPDDLYALFAQAEPPTPAADPSPPNASIATESSDPSVVERLAAWDRAPAESAPLIRRASDADLQRAAAASRLAALVVQRRRLAAERSRASIRIEVIPPPDRGAPSTGATPNSPQAAPQPALIINAIPLPPAIAPDSAHPALMALRVAGRLLPLLLPAPATRSDTPLHLFAFLQRRQSQ